MKVAKLAQKKAQQQANKIILQARTQAILIRQHALARTKRMREFEARRRIHNKEVAQELTKQAKEVSKKAVRLFRINLANTLTLFNGVCGFISILLAIEHHFIASAALILAGVVFDWLDGKAARLFAEESPLGAQLDSLSDLVTFGVAPAVLVANIYPSFFAYAAGALFVLSAALRLGRFNVQQTKGVYFGTPTTTNGIVLPLLIFLGLAPMYFAWYLLIFALLMNAPIKIRKVF